MLSVSAALDVLESTVWPSRNSGVDPRGTGYVAVHRTRYRSLRGRALVALPETRAVGHDQLLLPDQFPVTIFDTVSDK